MTTTTDVRSIDEVLDELRTWLGANWDPDLTVADWWQRLGLAGWSAPALPADAYGRGLTRNDALRVHAEIAAFGALGPPAGLGQLLAAPTIAAHGTPGQVDRHVRDIVTGQRAWCQLFSEPGAGSDLAGLGCRAERDGDEFVVNGQKVWTSMAHVADWCFLLVRTDPSAARHKGISFLLVDMKTPGISIRPLRQITGEAEFNEVFFDNVRVPAENLVHKLNEGWAVAITTLAYERDLLTFIRHISLRNALHRLVKLAKTRGAGEDPIMRQRIAGLWIGEQALQMNAYRSLTRILRGGAPGPEGSTSKLFWSQLDQELALTATEVIGPYSQIAEGSPWAVDHGQWEFYELLARGSGIRAGTSEILRNILAERVLGLAKD